MEKRDFTYPSPFPEDLGWPRAEVPKPKNLRLLKRVKKLSDTLVVELQRLR